MYAVLLHTYEPESPAVAVQIIARYSNNDDESVEVMMVVMMIMIEVMMVVMIIMIIMMCDDRFVTHIYLHLQDLRRDYTRKPSREKLSNSR
jgi:hypothetical protein